MRILIAEDHPVFAEGLYAALTEIATSVKMAYSPEDALAQLARNALDLVLLDLSFKGSQVSGMHILRHIRTSYPQTLVVILSMYDDPSIQAAAKSAGARGFVSKTESNSTVIEAVRAVLAGGTWFLPREATSALSPRQLQVVRRVICGRNHKEIAGELGLTLRTVDFHIEAAKRALHVTTTAELISTVNARGLLLIP